MALERRLSLTTVVLCGGAVVTLSMGIRHGFGFWQLPMIQAHDGWTRGTFAIAIAIQNLLWGAAQPIAGMVADRFGAVRVIVVSAVLYALGLAGMAIAPNVLGFSASGGVLIGVALAGTTYAIVYGVVGRTARDDQRSQALGIVAAAGSLGQFLMVPIERGLIDAYGWQDALLLLAIVALAMIPLTRGVREPAVAPSAGRREQSPWQAAREAFAQPSFRWLMAGYFVCGFQLVFIGVHLPAYLRDHGLAPKVAVGALALIGLFNIFGTYAAGQLGARLTKKYLLASIYLARAGVIVLFLVLPLSPLSVYVFAAAIGFLWLSTVPLTSGVIATIFGVRYLSMLSGVVFFSHQVGSFVGVLLGGWMYDRFGNYDAVWAITVALGLFAALANLPIRERALVRAPMVAAAS